ncbi:hypothetical protein Purlil1_13305 [Purpureocillium lilacinum]|uniref:CFEM domain-containing protein n=1 Tax=Purpureocillium lilacinum TaxID=33203 RepID=A0ABR0BEF3_PURLI|nr:hypothetical protein Purlil1_13305 [Purpureocillium lilacinum]
MYTITLTLLFAIHVALFVNADIDFDINKVPSACKSLCGPIGQLLKQCGADPNDRVADLDDGQCICRNQSFDVAKVAAQCAGCIHQDDNGQVRRDDHDSADKADSVDVDSLMKTCGFSSVSYSPSDSGVASSVTAASTMATAASRSATPTRDSQPAQTTGRTTMTSAVETRTKTAGGSRTSSVATTSSRGNAAAATEVPPVVYAAGAFVVAMVGELAL